MPRLKLFTMSTSELTHTGGMTEYGFEMALGMTRYMQVPLASTGMHEQLNLSDSLLFRWCGLWLPHLSVTVDKTKHMYRGIYFQSQGPIVAFCSRLFSVLSVCLWLGMLG